MLITNISSASIEDYIFSDIGYTSNMHGELGLINIPSSRISDAGTLKLHLSNSEPLILITFLLILLTGCMLLLDIQI